MTDEDAVRELLRRAEDLAGRCESQGVVTATKFLTPAEQAALADAGRSRRWDNLYFFGGQPDCERKVAFFLPFYVNHETFDPGEYIRAVRVVTRFAAPSHRDYLGSLMGLGIERGCIGDIRALGEEGYFFCLASVEAHVLASLDRVGRAGAEVSPVLPTQVPAEERRKKDVSFTVKSPRLDAVAAGLFSLQRAEAAGQIALGAAAVNYRPCLKPDAPVAEGDVISLRGRGKGTIRRIGGQSRKGRVFVDAEVYQ